VNPSSTSNLPRRSGFTLIEMLTTVALLVIVLGLMVSLARDVRNRSADNLTKDILRKLDRLVDQYRAKALTKLPPADRLKYPDVHPLVRPGPIDEGQLQEDALENNKALVHTLKQHFDLSGSVFNELSIANYNEVTVLDAWGKPVVYMPQQRPRIGMAAGNRSFFFSAGPDRKYMTYGDNLYSYESGRVDPAEAGGK
jgi:prepilin-type N-terminal cleavage/methylation domain-containing protein